MNKGLNKVMLIGKVEEGAEIRRTPSGRAVASFAIAVPRTWTTPEGERREQTEWFNVVAWGNLAEICNQRLGSEAQVYVDGRLQTRGWEDENGRRHFRTEVVANELIVIN